jgi:glycosyltransferase involved in cell wall biosynthesis
VSKILVLTTCYPSYEDDPSGAFVAKLLAAIRRRGHSVKVVAPATSAFHGRKILHHIETVRFGYFWPRSMEKLTDGQGGIPENIARSRLAKFQILPMMLMFLLKSIKEALSFDVIYANWIGAGLIGAIAGYLTGKPLVVSLRGDDGYLARDRFVWRIITRFVCRRAEVTAPVNKEIIDIVQNLGIASSKLFLPRFGVDTSLFRPPEDRLYGTDEFQILFVGALVPKKGLHNLLEALSMLHQRRFRFRIIGDGFYKTDLEVLAKKLGIWDRIDWLGERTSTEVSEIMRQSNLLCLPSFTEGSPNVIKEAMASGLPVLASDIGGIPDLVIDGKTGILHPVGDVQAIRQGLEEFLSNPSIAVEMGMEGRNTIIRKGLTWDSTAEDFDSLFEALTNRDSYRYPERLAREA